MSITIGVGVGDAADAARAVHSAVEQARAQLGEASPQAAYITTTVDHDAARVHAAFRQVLAGVPLHGVTTSLGVLTPAGVRNEGHGAVAVMQGIASVCPDVPCQGGSAADHAIAGQWSVFTHEGPVPAGVSLLGIFGEVRVGTSLSTPYIPSGVRARATGARGRTLLTLDGQPAARVLGRWLEGAIDDQVRSGGNILAQTALRPVAVRRDVGGRDHYVTVHPAQIHADTGAVDIFANIAPEDEVCLMSGTAEGLVAEVSHLIDAALAQGNLTTRDVKGAALIFCAGCAGALGPRIDEGLRTFSRLLPGVPLLGLCTFGEQGFIPGLGNVHQDLSLSLTLFA